MLRVPRKGRGMNRDAVFKFAGGSGRGWVGSEEGVEKVAVGGGECATSAKGVVGIKLSCVNTRCETIVLTKYRASEHVRTKEVVCEFGKVCKTLERGVHKTGVAPRTYYLNQNRRRSCQYVDVQIG